MAEVSTKRNRLGNKPKISQRAGIAARVNGGRGSSASDSSGDAVTSSQGRVPSAGEESEQSYQEVNIVGALGQHRAVTMPGNVRASGLRPPAPLPQPTGSATYYERVNPVTTDVEHPYTVARPSDPQRAGERDICVIERDSMYSQCLL